jgi:flagellar capping protein FliD
MTVSRSEFDSFKAETSAAIEKLDADLKSSHKTIIEHLVRLEQHLYDMEARMEKRLDAMDKRLDAMDKRLDAMDKRFDAMDKRFDAMDKRFDAMDKRFDAMEQRFEQRFSRLSEDVTYMGSNFASRFDVFSGHLRVGDQGQLRSDERLSSLERRVDILENRAS